MKHEIFTRTSPTGGVDAVVIKTISSFPKDVSDIDLLIASKEDLEKASRIMRKVGYYLAKPGLEQDLWRRIVNGVVVDVEIHTSIAAADYEYYPKKLVFERAVLLDGVKGTVANGLRIDYGVTYGYEGSIYNYL